MRLARIPARPLVAANLTASIGLGLYGVGSLLYFTRVAGLSVVDVGIGISSAGVVGLVAGVAAGRVADRFGARRMAVLSLGAQAVLVLSMLLVRSFPVFLVAICALAVAEQAGQVSISALVARVGEPDERVSLSAYLGSALNLGVTVGVLLAAGVIALDTPAWYGSVLVTHAVTSILSAALVLRVAVPPGAAPSEALGLRRVLTDRAYLAVAVLCGLIMMSDVILTVGLPLWLVTYTPAPRWLAPILLGVNTVLVVILQVRASRGVSTVTDSGRRLRLATALSTLACALFALSAGRGVAASIALLGGAVVVLTLGELSSSAGAWQLRYALAHEDAQGAYGGVFSLSNGLRITVGPVLVTSLMTGLRGIGWLVMGGVFVGLALTTYPVLAWAVRTRARQHATSGSRS